MKALIIGGGIGGCATALALHKVGIRSEIFEARHKGDEGAGAFLTLAVNGVSTLRSLGLDVSRLAGAVDTFSMQLALSDGTRLATIAQGEALKDGTVSRTIKRADLYLALRDKVESLGIPIHYGRRLATAEGSADAVTATFDDDTTARGDLLVGADGLHSRTRRIIDPDSPNPRYLGLLNVGGYASGVEVAGSVGTMHMTFGKRVFFTYLPAESGEVWWFANPAMKREPRRSELAGTDWRSTMLDLVAEDTSPATEVINATPQLFAAWPTHDFPKVPVWHRDRMLIIGDAAHAASPSSGQGASMAIEDAAVLALALRDSASIDEAFIEYERVRRPRVSKIVAVGKRNGNGKTPGAFGRVIRDFVLRRIFAKPPKTQDLRWMYEFPIEWDAGLASVKR